MRSKSFVTLLASLPVLSVAGANLPATKYTGKSAVTLKRSLKPRTETTIHRQGPGGYWRFTRRLEGYTEYEHRYMSGGFWNSWTWIDPSYGNWNGDIEGHLPIPFGGVQRVILNGSGTVTLKAVWVDSQGREGQAAITPPPPAYLPLKITPFSEAMVEGHDYFVHSHKTDNGYDDPEIHANISGQESWRRNTKRLKVFNSSSGVVEFSLGMEAAIDVQSNPNGWATAWVWCDIDAEIDDRNVNLSVAGVQNKRLKLTGLNINYVVTTSDGVAHLRPYPGTAQENTPVDDSGPFTNNGMLYIGLPVKDQTVTTNIVNSPNSPPAITVVTVPPVIDDHIITYSGTATQKNIPTEVYTYTTDGPGLSGSLPGVGNSWAIPNLLVPYTPPVKLITKSFSNSGVVPDSPMTTINDNDVSSGDSVRFKYKWADGVVGEASRTVQLKRAVEQVSVLPVVIDFNVNDPWTPIPFDTGEWREPMHPSGSVTFGPKLASWQYGAWAVVIATPLLTGPSMPQVVLIGTICAVLEKTMEYYAGTQETVTVNRGSYSSVDLVLNANGSLIPSPGPYPSTQWAQDYYWRIEVRPKSHIFPIVFDRWGNAGYEGRDVVQHKVKDGPLDSPRRHVWKYKVGMPGAQP